MRVLLINQPWICNDKEYGLRSGIRWPMIRKRDRTMPYYPFPFPLAYATSYLLAKGIDTVLRDSIALEETKEEALAFINENQFPIIVLEGATASIYHDVEFCKALKELNPNTIVAMTGYHASAFPEEVMEACPVDYILTGEYTNTLYELVIAIENNNDMSQIPGIVLRKENTFINTGKSKLVPFDEVPAPFRDQQLVGKYNEPSAKHYPNLPMMTSLGCCYKCTFCVEAGSSFRYRSIPKVIEEIKMLVTKNGVKEIFFDDSFIPTPRLEELAKAIIDEKIDLKWSCWIDRNTKESTLQLMKQSGCCGVKIGVETFDPTISGNVKKNVSLDQVRHLVSVCRRLGLVTHASYMFGLPGETKESIDYTIKQALGLKTTTNQFSILVPLPGTALFDEAKKENRLSTLQWDQYEGQDSVVLKYDNLTATDLRNAMKKVRRLKIIGLLKNPPYLMITLFKIFKIMGPKRFLVDMMQKTAFLISRN